jgi:redox-sensitive bicupin YhaK (pirin superfamily)
VEVIRHGEIQTMSADTGIMHSEYNKNCDREVPFLQNWILPNKQGTDSL